MIEELVFINYWYMKLLMKLMNHSWLVVWLPCFLFSHSVGNVISPIDGPYFSEGWPTTTNQIGLSNRNHPFGGTPICGNYWWNWWITVKWMDSRRIPAATIHGIHGPFAAADRCTGSQPNSVNSVAASAGSPRAAMEGGSLGFFNG